MSEKLKNTFLKSYEKIIDNPLDLDEDLFEKIMIIINNSKNSFENQKIDEIDDYRKEIEMISIINNLEELQAYTFSLLIEGYLDKDIEKLEKIVKLYEYNPEVSIQEYAEIEDDIDLIRGIEIARESVEEKETATFLVDYDRNKHSLNTYYKMLCDAKSEYDDEETIDNVIKEFKDELFKYEASLENKDELDESLYDDLTLNYIVFLNLDAFNKALEEMTGGRGHGELENHHIASKLKKITKLEETEYMNSKITRIIKDRRKQRKVPKEYRYKSKRDDRNLYNIREFKIGRSRLGVKKIENAKIDGKQILLIILPSYGDIGDKDKQDGLVENLTQFENDIETYRNYKRIFSPTASLKEQAEARKVIEESENYYRSIVESEKKEKQNETDDKSL